MIRKQMYGIEEMKARASNDNQRGETRGSLRDRFLAAEERTRARLVTRLLVGIFPG